MFRPGEFHEHRHHDCGENGITRMISQPGGQKTEDQIVTLPVPVVLVQEVNARDHEEEKEFFHASLNKGLCVSLTPSFNEGLSPLGRLNRFKGFLFQMERSARRETVETVWEPCRFAIPRLKPGVNERTGCVLNRTVSQDTTARGPATRSGVARTTRPRFATALLRPGLLRLTEPRAVDDSALTAS